MTAAALEQAITFLSRTDLIPAARLQSLPSGVTELLKISSGDYEALLAAQESSRHSQEDVRHAAQFYVQQILFAPDGDHYRVLGVDPDDVESKIKLHYRLLVRWLHPDKNSSDWEVVYSDRINRAWHAIRTPDRRREYDEQLTSLGGLPADTLPNRELQPAQWRHAQSNERFISSRTIKRLPIAVFGMLGVTAVFALWWFSQLQPQLETSTVQSSVSPRETTNTQKPAEPSNLASESDTNPVMIESFNETSPALTPEMQVADVPTQQEETRSSIEAITLASKPLIAKTEAPVTTKPASSPLVVDAKKISIETTPVKPKLIVSPTKTNINTVHAAPPKPTTPAKHSTTTNVSMTKAELQPATAYDDVVTSEIAQINQYDSEVKHLLKQFSRVYADGNYFALHGLFTKDLNIIGAPAQRKVLHSYRQLFESSQQRQIAIQKVTWLNNDEKIIVNAQFETQVLPEGTNETQSTRGAIRLDLRMENGELKIIRLQSDSKNG